MQYEEDEQPEPLPGDSGTCAACGQEIVLRAERTVLRADGTDGHGQPGGQHTLVWHHEDVAVDYGHDAVLGGPA